MSLFSIINAKLTSNLSRCGISELSSHYIFHPTLSEKELVFDLGANTGSFYKTLKAVYDCECIAIEASPILFNKLPSASGVSTFNYAICKSCGPVDFFISDNQEANSLKHSIANKWGVTNQINVEGITFEAFLEKHKISNNIGLLKVDIEGAELDLIESMSDNTLSKIAQIAIEFHDFIEQEEVYISRMLESIEKLKRNNFIIIKISNNDYREVLCINSRLIELSFMQYFRIKVTHNFFQLLKRAHIVLRNKLKNAI